MLFGEILRCLGGPAWVLDQPTIYLPASGHWELGLARLRPALDGPLSSTVLAVAWRQACVDMKRDGWPGWPAIARCAVTRVEIGKGKAVAWTPQGQIRLMRAERTWSLGLPFASAVIAVKGAGARDWSAVDRVAELTAAALGWPWRGD
jgi:hypothetical protein